MSGGAGCCWPGMGESREATSESGEADDVVDADFTDVNDKK